MYDAEEFEEHARFFRNLAEQSEDPLNAAVLRRMAEHWEEAAKLAREAKSPPGAARRA